MISIRVRHRAMQHVGKHCAACDAAIMREDGRRCGIATSRMTGRFRRARSRGRQGAGLAGGSVAAVRRCFAPRCRAAERAMVGSGRARADARRCPGVWLAPTPVVGRRHGAVGYSVAVIPDQRAARGRAVCRRCASRRVRCACCADGCCASLPPAAERCADGSRRWCALLTKITCG